MTTIRQLRLIIDTAIENLSLKLTEAQAECDVAFYEHSCDWQQLDKRVMYLRGKIDTLKVLKDVLKTK